MALICTLLTMKQQENPVVVAQWWNQSDFTCFCIDSFVIVQTSYGQVILLVPQWLLGTNPSLCIWYNIVAKLPVDVAIQIVSYMISTPKESWEFATVNWTCFVFCRCVIDKDTLCSEDRRNKKILNILYSKCIRLK